MSKFSADLLKLSVHFQAKSLILNHQNMIKKTPLILHPLLCSIGSGYKVSELASLSEGETLMVGGKQVEVMGIISSEDYAKGRCFQEVQTEQTESHAEAVAPPCHRPASKPFTPPTMLDRAGNPGPKSGGEQTYRPRYDPFAPSKQTTLKPHRRNIFF